MKQIVLVMMTLMTLTGPASANDWDYFWGTTVKTTFEDLGRTLDPKTSGWDDFWYQCQDPDKDFGDCVGTVAAGVAGTVFIVPVVAGAALLSTMIVVSALPMAATAPALLVVNPAAVGLASTI